MSKVKIVEEEVLVTFGYNHAHKLGSTILDKDIVLQAKRSDVHKALKGEFAFDYPLKKASSPKFMMHFPRGIVHWRDL